MFELLFKYPAATFSQGKLVLLATWPGWVLALLSLLVCAGLAALLRHSGVVRSRAVTLWVLQAAPLILLLLMLWQPALSITALKPGQNIIAVLIDTSRSMGLTDGGPTREEQAKHLLEAHLLPQFGRQYQVRLYEADNILHRIENADKLTPSAPATKLNAALREIADEAGRLPIGAVVLLSDGADTTGGIDSETMAALMQRRLPVNTIGFGQTNLRNDAELESVEVADKVLAGSRMDALIRIRQNGFAGRRTALRISSAGRMLATREITLTDAPEQVEHVEFTAGDAGIRTLEVKLQPIAEETNKANNQLTAVMRVDGGKRRILYVEGEPRWEYKFLRRAVEDDPAVAIVSMLRTTQNKIYRQGIAKPEELADGFPAKPEDLFQYDGLLLGSVEAGFFNPSQQAAIRDFVDKRGGGLLFLGGRSALADGGYIAPPFSELLPVHLPHSTSSFHRSFVAAELTSDGKRSLLTRIEDDPEKSTDHWEVLPYLADYQEAGTPKDGAVVLANVDVAGHKLPLLVTENYGRGRTALFATGGSWRWRMQQPVGDTSQETFWRQLLRWTVDSSPSRVTAMVSNRQLQDDGQVVLHADVRTNRYEPESNAQVQAIITDPSGHSETVSLRADPAHQGAYQASWTAVQSGSYMAEIRATDAGGEAVASDVATFHRDDGTAENFHQEQNRDLLQKLANQTGGHYYTLGNAPRLTSDIAFSSAGITIHEFRELWNMPVLFLMLIGLRSCEWMLRRRWGAV